MLLDFANIIYNTIIAVYVFLSTLAQLFVSIVLLITNIFYSLFATNYYASITFGVILMGISLVIFLRIWNIIADIQVFGWKLPKL